MTTAVGEDAEETHPLAISAVVATVLTWGFGPIFVRLIDAPGLTAGAYRLGIGSIVMAVICVVFRRVPSPADLKRSLPAGALFAVNVVFFFEAVRQTSIADATLISSMTPVVILFVAGPLFGEMIRRSDVVWTLVAIVGVVIVVFASSGTPVWSLRGDLLAFGALVTWTAYFLTTKSARAHQGTIEYQLGVMVGGSIVLAPAVLLVGDGPTGLEASGWLYLVLMVLLPGVIGHGLLGWAHRYVRVSVSSVIVLATPVAAIVIAAVLLDEPFGPGHAVGGLVVIVGVAAVALGHNRTAEEVLVGDAPALEH